MSVSPIPLQRNPAQAPQPKKQKLGSLLVEAGYIDKQILRDALARKHRTGAPLGEILVENGLLSGEVLAAALAHQSGQGSVDLLSEAPDRNLLVDIRVPECLRIGCIPWRRVDGELLIAVKDLSAFEAAKSPCGVTSQPCKPILAAGEHIRHCLETNFREELAEDALTRCPADQSCRNWSTTRVKYLALLCFAAISVSTWIAPSLVVSSIVIWVIAVNALTMVLRGAALIARWKSQPRRADEEDAVVPLADQRTPVVSLLVPLHKETEILPALLRNISAIDYPIERLDLKFLIEENDVTTQKALNHLEFTTRVDIIKVPDDTLKTKPRALNFGLNFCKGELIGILDAEDRPAPDQIRKVVQHLHAAPPSVACVQGKLDFYNTDHNWLTRCFTIEYAVWFDVLLTGFRRLGLPIPLGGTTVYFRRSHLERLCGWDAHNVTEDADLGMRIARMGYRTEILPSTTLEEANGAFLPWIRQRSRWLKGYLMTWGVHMRRPITLWRDLGTSGFLAFQMIFLGGITAYLSIPVFWAMAVGLVFPGPMSLANWIPDSLVLPAKLSMALGQVVMWGVIFTALSSLQKRRLIPWALTLVFYWPIGAAATLKALIELATKPFYWDKTTHGGFSRPKIR